MTRLDSTAIARAHDAMADEYDRIIDPWYTYLFGRIHRFLLECSSRTRNRPGRALDVGCGTGLQAFLLADAGYDVEGFDLSEGLVEKGRAKQAAKAGWDGSSAFSADMASLHEKALRGRTGSPGSVRLQIGDAMDPACYRDGPFDLIVCCGSVLSFVEDPDRVLRNMRSALQPDGRVVVELEMKANIDLIWPVIDRIVGGRLGYELGWAEAVSNLFRWGPSDLVVAYPFETTSGALELPMRLFSHRALRRRFSAAGFAVTRMESIHAITNLIPSTVLHDPAGPSLERWFRVLARLDAAWARTWPIRRLGCSAIFELQPD